MPNHHWTIDGIEEGVARVEQDGKQMITIPAWLLPPAAKEGQIVSVTQIKGATPESIAFTIAIDAESTKAALAKSKAVVDRASAESRKRDPGGNVNF